jgi:NRPS condensation-like uncharacterized protein
VENTHSSWQIEVAKELATPFDYATAPLMRAVLLRDDNRATLILVSHHSVADGMGASLVIQDMLRALTGEQLAPLNLTHPMERLLEAEMHDLEPSPAPLGSVIPKTYRPLDAIPPHIATLSLTPALTAALVKRSRDEGTTVHGALAAAICEAGRRLTSEWCNRPVRTLTPINIRELTKDAATAVGVYLSMAVTSDEHRSAPRSGTLSVSQSKASSHARLGKRRSCTSGTFGI